MTQPAPADNRCYRHPQREAYIGCQRCGRKICPDCMRDASVGFHCPECVAEAAKSVRTPRTMAGGSVPAREGVVSMTLIGINVIVFVAMLATGDKTSPLYEQGALFANSLTSNTGQELTGVADGGLWRLLTSAFLHDGPLHILFNMYALYLFGPLVERALGVRRFIATYFTMAIVASVFVYVLSGPFTVTIGASGAVFGLFGIALLLLHKAKQDVTFLLILLGINGVISLQGNISWQGHLGGFVAGIILGAVFAYAPRERRTQLQLLVFTVVWIASVSAIVLRTAQLTA